MFTYEGNLLYPLIFLSFLLGINFNFDRLITKPVVQFFDSISRVFYHINSLVIELIGFGIIPLAANLVLQLRINPERILFKQLALILGIDSVIIIFGVFPLILYFFGGRQNPYKWIYAALSSAIAGFVSRDSFFTLSILTKHGRESYGIPRKVGSAVFPLLSMIGKAGTAMVASVGFLLIIKSYSSLGITWFQFFWVLLFTFLTSFLLGSAPATGSLVAISFLCKFYGRGIEEGYLILNGIMLILISFGVLIDVISHSAIALLVTKHENLHQEIETNNFI
ncbi:MAG: dicarboxylate/amino acid:cation symporter [Spirochaetales bacterium]|nr:MAG: dicarboxylate/amino acid:cation symporter [Spirochaetales bacterium]